VFHDLPVFPPAANKQGKMMRKALFFLMVASLAARTAYLYIEVGQEHPSRDGNAPTIFYARPAQIHKGDHPGNMHLVERLNRLHYKRVSGIPSSAGTFSADQKHIRIFLRSAKGNTHSRDSGWVEMVLQEGRVVELRSSTGGKLESIELEPEELGRLPGQQMELGKAVPLAGFSPFLQSAVVASQDQHFYDHMGVDIFSFARLFFSSGQKEIPNRSTITRQVVQMSFLLSGKTLSRKFREIELALAMELRYSKKEILEMYLNRVYLGMDGTRRIYGFENASRFYFGKPAKNLSLAEAAALAGIINEPGIYNLFKNPQKVKERRCNILTGMQKSGMMTEDEYHRACDAPVHARVVTPPARLSCFIDYIQRITRDATGIQRFYRAGYRYFTTLDTFHQSAAEEAVALGLADIEGVALPADEPLQAALVAVDPKSGAMTAMVGGRSYAQSWFNRAVDAQRQPGSAFKPFVLLAALAQTLSGEKKMTLSTLISGEPITLPTPEGLWTPANFEDKQYGNITVRKLIEDSVNTATVRLARETGFQDVLNTARLAGIRSPLAPAPSLPLGSFEVSPVELAYAYTTIASGGIRFERFPLYSVTTANGEKVIERGAQPKRAFDPRVAYLTGYALEGVLERGTAKEARSLNMKLPVSGKTGTTNGNRDSWFVSFTPDVVCAVWVGYDSGADTGLTGAQGALRINARFLRALYSQSGPPPLTVPQGIETALIDLKSGYLATPSCPETIREAYLMGTAPKQYCPDHR